ncbi:uncharacterized protein LOC113556613 isoform X2 [Rhopalosiphum maidis]|nr:uncharacterized protein LOC113556613 isoform X2 [Rhopalosiphum maidis]XP_026817472.1 uncharacterized protein LOC113556613 isoform X2 [Rhopalosiphum maidis]
MDCQDLTELKIVVRSVLVACQNSLTVEELWKKVTYIFGKPQQLQTQISGYRTPFNFLKSIPDVVQLDDPEDTNSIVNIISSELSRHMELLVPTNITRPPKSKNHLQELLVPYRTQCAFIRILYELYPEGLSISDFESDILCIPIFQSYIKCVDKLLSNLDHIFLRKGSEIISLQPNIINSLKEIETKGKFTAMDICNIDEYSLENKYDDKLISNGLEYPLFNILEESIKTNIEQLLDEVPGWISDRHMCNLYIEKFGSAFTHYRRWGFTRVSQMFSKLPELCCVHFSNNEVEIFSTKNHTCDINKNIDVLEDENKNLESGFVSISVKKKYDNKSDENDGVLKKFLRNDPYLEASLSDCFLEEEIKHFDLKINNLFNVNVCGVNTSIVPSIICQCIDQYQEFQKLLVDMKNFYFINDSQFLFDPNITMVKQTYAYFLDDFWFRGVVIDTNLGIIKMVNIDYGSMHTIPLDDIRLLHVQFAQLPAQSFTCNLHGIDSIDENELLGIIDKKCTIYVVSTDQQNKSASVKIKFMDSISDKYLNDEWVENGIAQPDSDEE